MYISFLSFDFVQLSDSYFLMKLLFYFTEFIDSHFGEDGWKIGKWFFQLRLWNL